MSWDVDTVEQLRPHRRAGPARGRATARCSCRATPGSTPPGSPSAAELGFDAVYLHHVGQEQQRVHRRLRRTSAPAARGHAAMKITDTCDLWWKTAVVYCLDVETFLDWGGDGTGDIAGLVQRIDYLAEIGVTCLWLMPFYPTPDRDDGYDITDFYGVDERVGNHGDFVELVRTARDRGMRVIVDLVVNHTSDQHPWFRSARSSRTSRYRDWYVWADDPPKTPARGRRLPRPGDQPLAVGREGRPALPAPLLQAPARPERRQPGRAGRDRQDHGLLARARRLRLPGGRRPLPHRDHQGRGRAGSRCRIPTPSCASCVPSWAAARATRSSSAR